MIKKIGAAILALMFVFVLALDVSALAADNDGDLVTDGIAGNTDGVWENADTPVVQTDKTAILYKEIKAYNPDNSKVNAPTITYTYTVTPGSKDKDIYDDIENHESEVNAHVLTKQGITAGIKVNGGDEGDTTKATGTLSWSPSEEDDQLSANNAGEKNTKQITIDFSQVTFTGAGVYRYKIEETAASYATSGVVEGTTGHIRYLDVYVKDGETAGTYEIYGFVCFVNDNAIDARETPELDTVSAAVKTEGFVTIDDPDNDPETDDAMSADQYYTYNLTVKKELVGDQAMNGHEFPFKVTFANTTVTDPVLPIVTGDGTKPTLTAGNINNFIIDGTSQTTAQQMKLANEKSVTFTGIPAGTKATIDEYNDVVGTVYTTTTDKATENEEDGIALAWNTWASANDEWGDPQEVGEVYALGGEANENAAAAENFTGDDNTVIFTNTLLTISPTGVVLRIAPYIMILAAGIVLLLISRCRKAAVD